MLRSSNKNEGIGKGIVKEGNFEKKKEDEKDRERKVR